MGKIRHLAKRALNAGRPGKSGAESLRDISWDALSDHLRGLAESGTNIDEMAMILAKILPVYVKEPYAARFFKYWERHGFHLTPVHFHQPVPDTRALDEALWARPSETVGIDWNEARQVDLLSNVFPKFQTEYESLATGPTGNPHEFHFDNGSFDWTDAMVFYCMARHFQPGLIIEVGSGFSTRLAARAALLNGNTELIAIDPHPDQVFRDGFKGLSSLIEKRVQEVDFDFFGRLGPGDILFINSSHVVKCGADVNYLFLEVIPRLKPGVIVHVQGIFLPNEFPREWVLDLHLFWTEQYLLQAFLAFNSEFEILFANAYMGLRHKEAMRKTFPKSKWWGGGSFWMRRRG